ncbi:MAG TPA: hypothetical protein PKC65_05100 [Pyrinomonadaceae bacterium]|nr:hypothetical protein [Pyrinomonadaceae bacterium]
MFPRIVAKPKSGQERLVSEGKELGFSVLDFWRWSSSDLLSNATRGVLAEFIVAVALEIQLERVREEWGAYDLTTPEGIKVEVKSAAFIQSWRQDRLSKVSFRVPKTRAWDSESNRQANEIQRQADVYVFCLLAHTEQEVIDPLDLDQWQFFVLPTAFLDGRKRSQHSITLKSLADLSHGHVDFHQLRARVLASADIRRESIELS